MKALVFIAMSLIGGCMVLLMGGCGGTATALNPTVAFNFDERLPPIPSRSILVISGTITPARPDDAIKSIKWTQEPADPAYNGIFLIDENNINTNWEAPAWPGPERLPVDLILTVETIMGGRTVKRLHLMVEPTVLQP